MIEPRTHSLSRKIVPIKFMLNEKRMHTIEALSSSFKSKQTNRKIHLVSALSAERNAVAFGCAAHRRRDYIDVISFFVCANDERTLDNNATAQHVTSKLKFTKKN